MTHIAYFNKLLERARINLMLIEYGQKKGTDDEITGLKNKIKHFEAAIEALKECCIDD